MMAGGLRSRVVIEQQSATQDAVGQPINTWVPVATVWANVRNIRGMEAVQSDMQFSVLRASIRIRYRQDITADMRVVHGSKVYQILAVSPDEIGKKHVDLICEEYSV